MMIIMDYNQKGDTSSAAVSSSRQDPNPKNIIVGVGEDLIQLKDRLIGQASKALQVIPIVGMGGIGKTTLARNLYDDPSVTSHFDTFAWATISQDYNKQKLQDVLLSLLECMIGKPNIDEMANTNQDFWGQVSGNVSSTVADKDEHFSNILSLSYNHLPNHLKPCFLYMGAFPEDYEIRSSRLINLLVAEGLVRPISDKSVEEAAKMHLKALVDRNLIFVSQQGTNGNAKSYSIHDLLRDLCVRKACEEKFLFIHRGAPHDLARSTSCLRRVCSHGPFSFEDAYISPEQSCLARSLLLFKDIKRITRLYPMLSN
ncbi:UNVERIFIED_CONTAM: putative disease resistance RPP13-like protein 3 [Sesamum angustifolium]|uniref:Disease resistance RPP13-like protein 3 n=1 Tax=Sesamum angustifolium TaxID=2727405 RepID=A0AAW2QAR7_9LAMI